MSERWPRLGFNSIGGADPGKSYKKSLASLDYYPMRLDARWLESDADRIDRDMPGLLMWETAQVLRRLAKSKKALAALNVSRKVTPGGVLGLNRAVHLVRLELRSGRKKDALREVAAAWSVPEPTITDAVTDYDDQAKDALKQIAESYLRRPPLLGEVPATRAQFLEAFDGDLCDQARRMRKPPRRTRTARKKTR